MTVPSLRSTRDDQGWREGLVESHPAVLPAYQVIADHPTLGGIASDLAAAYTAIARSMERGGTLYLCGNGGSMSDALHISGELLKSFARPRPLPDALRTRLREQPGGEELAQHLQAGLRAHVLGINPTLASAVSNDVPIQGISYAQELVALARSGDVFLGISTSGKARNVLLAAQVARALDLTAIALTGASRTSPLAAVVDIALCVPEQETYRVQELHLTVYHQLCLMLEAHFF